MKFIMRSPRSVRSLVIFHDLMCSGSFTSHCTKDNFHLKYCSMVYSFTLITSVLITSDVHSHVDRKITTQWQRQQIVRPDLFSGSNELIVRANGLLYDNALFNVNCHVDDRDTIYMEMPRIVWRTAYVQNPSDQNVGQLERENSFPTFHHTGKNVSIDIVGGRIEKQLFNCVTF